MASDKVLPGGGAADIAVAKELKQYANTFEDKEQVAIVAFAKALEELALSLAANTGLNTIDILTDLLAAQQDSPNMGINVMTREVSDMLEDGVLESETTKAAIVDGAASIAVEILRIDDVVAARAETPVGGDMPGTPNPWM